MTTFLTTPVPHAEAMAFIKNKPAIAREVFDRLLPEIKARAFTITGIEPANILQTVRDRIADLPAGADWNDVKSDIVADISPFLVDPDADPEERDRQAVAADRRAELLLRTHGFQAYQAAQYNVMQEVKDVMPYWMYMTMEDEAVREAHAALDGIVLPADDPFWSAHYPPWDWGCRCLVVPISRDDYADIQKTDADRAPDQKQIIEGARYKALQEGSLILGPNNVVDVRSPVEKADQSIENRQSKIKNAFSWHPGDLRIPLEDLQNRYDDTTWKFFEDFAKRTTIPGLKSDVSIFDWLNGKPLPESAPLIKWPGMPPIDATPPVSVSPITPVPTKVGRGVPAEPSSPPPPPIAPVPTKVGRIVPGESAPRPEIGTKAAAPDTFASTLKDLGLDKQTAWGHDAVVALKNALKEENPVSAKDFIKSINGAAQTGNLSAKHLTAAVQNVLDMLPREIAEALPPLKIRVAKSLGKHVLGSYNPLNKTIEVATGAIGSSSSKLNTVMYHEALHWIRDNGPAWYKDEIKNLYQKRTAGEPLLTNSQTGEKYRKDNWWNWYAGKQYDHEEDPKGEGREVASKHFELFASPWHMAGIANDPAYNLRDNMQTIMSIFFKRP